MSNSILPKSSTVLERELEKILADASRLPIHINDLWDPQRCPEKLLPWLAWANSVDSWQNAWPESVKRQVIADSFQVHQHKGTPFAIQVALDSLGIESQIIEWWEKNGSGVRGTAKLTALLNDNITESGEGLINAEMLALITTAINNSKRGVIHHEIELGIYFNESFNVSAATPKSVGISDSSPESSGVIPDKLTGGLRSVSVAHSVNLHNHVIEIKPITPEKLTAYAWQACAAHQLILSSIELQGV